MKFCNVLAADKCLSMYTCWTCYCRICIFLCVQIAVLVWLYVLCRLSSFNLAENINVLDFSGSRGVLRYPTQESYVLDFCNCIISSVQFSSVLSKRWRLRYHGLGEYSVY
jgi:hypothetical protein